LFATDFSPCSCAAQPYAISLARKYGATLHAAHVLPTAADIMLMSPEGWPTIANEIELQTRQLVTDLEDDFQGVPHRFLTPKGKISDALTEIITGNEIDLVVLGTHGRTGIRKLALGSIAEEIFRRSRCPVLGAGPHISHKPDVEAKFHHILFATDFSPESLAASPYAISLAEEDEAQLAVLHVVGQPAAGIVNLAAVSASLERRLKELIPPDAEPWCHPQYLVEFGQQFASPAEGILKAAEDSATDLIVLGVRSVHGKLGLVTHLASTTAQILAHAACPVLTVRG
jgi:nucleotide-binding universal stress UspA family protein